MNRLGVSTAVGTIRFIVEGLTQLLWRPDTVDRDRFGSLVSHYDLLALMIEVDCYLLGIFIF